MDAKYNLVRRAGPGGLRYILVARDPDKVGLDVQEGSRRKRRKVQIGEVMVDVKAFSVDLDYEKLGDRYRIPGLRDRRECE